MAETYRFIPGNTDHNLSEIDRIIDALNRLHEHYAFNVSHDVNATRAKLRFTLSPHLDKGVHETQRPDYNLGIVEVDANADISEEDLLKPVSDALHDYEMGDRL